MCRVLCTAGHRQQGEVPDVLVPHVWSTRGDAQPVRGAGQQSHAAVDTFQHPRQRLAQRPAHSCQHAALQGQPCQLFCVFVFWVCLWFLYLDWFVCSGRAEVLCFSVISSWWCWERKQALVSLATCEFGERTWS